MTFLELLNSHWHWAPTGVLIGIVMLLLIFFGKTFGLSDTYRTMCSLAGASKLSHHFKFSFRENMWNIFFAGGIILGSFACCILSQDPNPVHLSSNTIKQFQSAGLISLRTQPSYFPHLPLEIFDLSVITSPANLFMLIVGGFLSGFGSRYAGGCTSGHFITGLSSLQIPSLITFIFFFIGGSISSRFIIPFLLSL